MLNQQGSNLAVMPSNPDQNIAVVQIPPRAEAISDTLAHIVWRRRRVVILTTLVCVFLSGLYLIVATPLYTTTARLLLHRTAPKFIPGGQSEPAPSDSSTFLFTQQQVITSTPVLAAAIGMPGVHQIEALRGHHDALAILKRQVIVDVGKKDELVSISFDSADPSEGTLLLNAVVDAYTRFQSSLRRDSNSDLLAVLADEKAKRDQELEDKSRSLLAFSESNGLSNESDKSNVTQQRLQGLAEALTAARLETVNARSAFDEVARVMKNDPERARKLAEFMKSSGSVLPSSSDDTVIRQEMLALKAREVELRQRFMSNHPSIIAIEKRMDELDIAFAAGVQNRYEVSRQHEIDLQRSFDEQQKVAFEQASRQDEFDRRKAEITRLEKLVETLDNRIKEVALTEDGGIPSVTVLEPARASDGPTHPDKLRTAALAALGGLLMGALLAVAGESTHGRVPVEDNAQVAFGVPVLGKLPSMSEEISSIARGQKILMDSGNDVAAACRSVHAALDGVAVEGRGMTILVTSPSPGDGKSTLASNLAINFAATAKRVLLVDANFRSPAQGRIFGLNGVTGLGTLLEVDEPLPVTAIHHTGTPYLDVILSGPVYGDPSESLNSQRFIDLLGDLAHRYDYVVLDSAAVGTCRDARTIAASCDATLMIVRSGRLNRQLFARAREGLMNVGANIPGVILNTAGDDAHSPSWNYSGTDASFAGKVTRTLRSIAVTANSSIGSARIPPTNAA